VLLQHVQAQFNYNKKAYLQEQTNTKLNFAKLGLTREVRCGGVYRG
jgi:hypothetical protein